MCTKEQQGSITIVFLVFSCPSLLPTGGLGPCHARFFLFPISLSFVHFKYAALVLYLNTVFILMLLCSKILSPARENPSSLIPSKAPLHPSPVPWHQLLLQTKWTAAASLNIQFYFLIPGPFLMWFHLLLYPAIT